jgi:hypothetical protein
MGLARPHPWKFWAAQQHQSYLLECKMGDAQSKHDDAIENDQ